MKTFALILALSSSVSGFATFDMKCDGEAKFKVMFKGTWTEENHPLMYPGDGLTGPNAHFSPLTGATSPYGSEFFKAGGMASKGVKDVAETGNNDELISELEADPMTYMSVTEAAGGAYNPWEMMIEVTADTMHDHLGLITMIAPSPDWFTGASMIELCDYETGEWKEEFRPFLVRYFERLEELIWAEDHEESL